ncbi:lysine-specific demethylase 4C-like protein [Leptotrombidium deliense]|uniref:[histone H3]-trimethyl-L-lysine(9) demethylase n=1 Tax=Leptotrombidium deliense TaxID=299467 RepID=A0A443SGD7_9ACAR|nr:lysine-specific demethylase 4C-like protein [Leptotrombidium deliense]
MGLNDRNGIPKIMVFRPTIEDMKDFTKYLERMEAEGANKAGLAKIIPPPEWCPRKGGYDDEYVNGMMIKAPIMQVVNGKQGLYQQYNIQKKPITVREFKKLAEGPKFRTPEYFDYEDLERKYWKNVSFNPAIYGADVPGTLYDQDVAEFNINHLNTILDLVNDSYGIKIMGVNTAYLYFGMWKTTFAWHTEDMDLYSINYLHYGAPKSWYAIPPEHGRRLERLATGFFPSSYKSCPSFLRHKMTLISPQVLKQYSIPYNKITQEPGEFMITFPYAYHAGYNHGYNCAESTNFALQRWVEYGKRATKCLCRSDSVKISMETFVKKFQPDRYELWLAGRDVGPHPEDPTHVSAAPPPSNYELAVLSKVNTSKSKRHPPYKGDSYEDSDTEEYSDSSCDGSTNLIPTKASKKIFDSFEAESKSPETESFLKSDPPNLIEPVKELHRKGAVPKKKKKTCATVVSPHLMSHSYSKPTCTTPNHPIKDLNWSTLNIPSVPSEFSRMIDNFLNCSNPYVDLNNGVKTDNISSSGPFQYENQASNPSVILPPPPLQIQQNKTNHEHPLPLPVELIKQEVDFNEQLPPPPPLRQHSVSMTELNSPFNGYNPISFPEQSSTSLLPDLEYADPKQFSSDLSSFSSSYLNSTSSLCLMDIKTEQSTEDAIVMDDSALQHTVDIPDKSEASTSTEDLPVNEIITNTKTIQSSVCSKFNFQNGYFLLQQHCSLQELLEWICKGEKKSELDQLLKCVPVPLHLYQHLPYNSFGEQLFNASVSTIYPHCAICVLLKKYDMSDDWLDDQKKIPKSSPVLIPNSAFAFKVIETNLKLDELGTSPLIVCSVCKVCVHEVCYGVINNSLDSKDLSKWKCDRCVTMKPGNRNCCLCPFRGGALKQTEDPSVWVHITCALMQPDAKFKNVICKGPVQVNGVKKTRGIAALRCTFCQKSNKTFSEYIQGYCIQCYRAPKCSSAFHVTCAYMAGINFETSDWPDPIRAYCKKCTAMMKNGREIESDKDDVELNTSVIARHKNRRFYEAVVIKKENEIRHHVHFIDNSFSENIRSSDILSHEWSESNLIEMGDQVKVSWNKETLTGKYSGNHSVFVYTLLFEDNSKCKARRKDFYLQTEDLPKKVAAKLVCIHLARN